MTRQRPVVNGEIHPRPTAPPTPPPTCQSRRLAGASEEMVTSEVQVAWQFKQLERGLNQRMLWSSTAHVAFDVIPVVYRFSAKILVICGSPCAFGRVWTAHLTSTEEYYRDIQDATVFGEPSISPTTQVADSDRGRAFDIH